ncbi:MAG TPA: M36 family metallopeptidase [Allosphingosinicella sp.]
MSDLLAKAQIVMDSSLTRPVKVRGNFPLPEADSTHEGVVQFLTDHGHELSVPFGAGQLQLAKEDKNAGRKVLRYDHTMDGLRVFGAQTIATVDEENRLRHLDLYAGPTRLLNAGDAEGAIDAETAVLKAGEAVGPHELRTDPPPPEEVWYPTDAGVVRAFVIIIPTAAPVHDWQVIIDAASGAVLSKRDMIVRMADGTGRIFDPNPVVTANNSAFRDPAATTGTCGFAGTPVATLDAQRVSRTLKDLTVASGNFTLSGPWCEIHEFAGPTSTIPTEASGNFNYSCNDARFNAVMIYYHIDTFQRYLQSIGIANAHASPIRCDPLDDSINAAWYSPVDHGLHFSDSGNCVPDRATDADCMIHEYQHAIQDNIVPGWGHTGPSSTGREEAGAMGEGAGDFVACAYFADRGGGFQREVFEDYVFAPAGLRRVDGIRHYPTGWDGDIHASGEIWSAALWNTYRAIGGDVGGAGAAAAHEAARQAMFRSLFGSYPLLATNASMPDGAEAIMRTNAALSQYRGAHLREMAQAFHNQGILAVDAGADIYIRDDSADPGTTAYHSPTFWDSPDVWIRNHDDGGTAHEQPVAGQDNWFYARVRNRGSVAARAFVVTFNVKLWLGTEFSYPADFAPYISAAPGFSLAPGANLVVKAKWPAALVPASGSHGCILVSAYSALEPIPNGAHVWEHPNLAQKNTIIQSAGAGDTVSAALRFGNATRAKAEVMTLEIRNPSKVSLKMAGEPAILAQMLHGGGVTAEPPPQSKSAPPPIRVIDAARIAVAHGEGALVVHLAAGSALAVDSAGAALTANASGVAVAKAAAAKLDPIRNAKGVVTGLGLGTQAQARMPVVLPPRADTEFRFEAKVPATAKRGAVHVVDFVQRNAADTAVGGVRLEIHVK